MRNTCSTRQIRTLTIFSSGPVAEKSSGELFALDSTGSEKIKQAYHKAHKVLKVDEILARRSAVPAVPTRKRPNPRVTDGVLEPSSKRQKANWVSKKVVQRLKDSIASRTHLTTDRLADHETSTFDVWADAPLNTDKSMEYMEMPKPKVAPSTLKRAPVAMTANGKPVRAFKRPDAGTSYNPLFEDWDNLLTREGDKEVEAERRRRREADEEADRVARVAAVSAAIDEVAAHIDDESAWEGFESGCESAGTVEQKRSKRKTQAERNKIKRRKEAERQAKHERQMNNGRKKSTAGTRSEDGNAKVSNSASRVVPTETDGSDSGDDNMLRRRRMGNMDLPEKVLEVVLPDELQESLRRLKPEGNLLNDRFRHLLVNGKLEARRPVIQPKKPRRTYTEKWTHKDFSLNV